MCKQLKILHIDDCKSDRDLVRKVFENAKDEFKLDQVSTHTEFLQKVNENIYDVILSELSIPDIKDSELINMIQKKYADARIIILNRKGSETIAVNIM
ncbi:response regulator [bacterium]|nr:response regulator [bacterium]